MSSRRVDVVIVGAGAAGLACASRLKAAGCKILVVEARDRIGGRIYSENAAGLELASILAMKPASVRRQLSATFHHDWISGPYSRGVYSYSRVGGASACVRMSRPVHDTIWFAGEAADRLGRTGTVHGAIGSGWRTADEILRP